MPYSVSQWEREVISGEQAAHDFAAMFGAEIQALAEWINRAPESVDVEAVFESICEDHDFDHTDDGYGTNWDWVRDTFEDYSPRLKAARIARQERDNQLATQYAKARFAVEQGGGSEIALFESEMRRLEMIKPNLKYMRDDEVTWRVEAAS